MYEVTYILCLKISDIAILIASLSLKKNIKL